MLNLATYTIDLVASVTDQEDGTELKLQSGSVCRIPNSDKRRNTLASWARFALTTRMPVALCITNDSIQEAASYTYREVGRVVPQTSIPSTANVWLSGRPGPYTFSLNGPEADSRYRLLLRSQETKCKLFFLLRGSHIESVTDLSPEQLKSLTNLGALLL